MYPMDQQQAEAMLNGASRKKAALAQEGRPKATRAALLTGKATKLAALNDWYCSKANVEMGMGA